MTHTYDVFISDNSEDCDSVVELAHHLRTHGLTVWLDIWELRPGEPRHRQNDHWILCVQQPETNSLQRLRAQYATPSVQHETRGTNNRMNSDWQFRCAPFPAGYTER